jgi:hypothetical protein
MDRANALRRAEPMRRASTIRADYSCAFVQVRLHPVRPRRLVRSSARADASNHESRGFALPKESSGVRAYTRLMLFVSFACVRACVRACVPRACARFSSRRQRKIGSRVRRNYVLCWIRKNERTRSEIQTLAFCATFLRGSLTVAFSAGSPDVFRKAVR